MNLFKNKTIATLTSFALITLIFMLKMNTAQAVGGASYTHIKSLRPPDDAKLLIDCEAHLAGSTYTINSDSNRLALTQQQLEAQFEKYLKMANGKTRLSKIVNRLLLGRTSFNWGKQIIYQKILKKSFPSAFNENMLDFAIFTDPNINELRTKHLKKMEKLRELVALIRADLLSDEFDLSDETYKKVVLDNIKKLPGGTHPESPKLVDPNEAPEDDDDLTRDEVEELTKAAETRALIPSLINSTFNAVENGDKQKALELATALENLSFQYEIELGLFGLVSQKWWGARRRIYKFLDLQITRASYRIYAAHIQRTNLNVQLQSLKEAKAAIANKIAFSSIPEQDLFPLTVEFPQLILIEDKLTKKAVDYSKKPKFRSQIQRNTFASRKVLETQMEMQEVEVAKYLPSATKVGYIGILEKLYAKDIDLLHRVLAKANQLQYQINENSPIQNDDTTIRPEEVTLLITKLNDTIRKLESGELMPPTARGQFWWVLDAIAADFKNLTSKGAVEQKIINAFTKATKRVYEQTEALRVIHSHGFGEITAPSILRPKKLLITTLVSAGILTGGSAASTIIGLPFIWTYVFDAITSEIEQPEQATITQKITRLVANVGRQKVEDRPRVLADELTRLFAAEVPTISKKLEEPSATPLKLADVPPEEVEKFKRILQQITRKFITESGSSGEPLPSAFDGHNLQTLSRILADNNRIINVAAKVMHNEQESFENGVLEILNEATSANMTTPLSDSAKKEVLRVLAESRDSEKALARTKWRFKRGELQPTQEDTLKLILEQFIHFSQLVNNSDSNFSLDRAKEIQLWKLVTAEFYNKTKDVASLLRLAIQLDSSNK